MSDEEKEVLISKFISIMDGEFGENIEPLTKEMVSLGKTGSGNMFSTKSGVLINYNPEQGSSPIAIIHVDYYIKQIQENDSNYPQDFALEYYD